MLAHPKTIMYYSIEPWGEPYIARNPWMSPGSAPVFFPCGVAGGNPDGCPPGEPARPGQDCGGVYKGGWSYGPAAEQFQFDEVVSTDWVRGGMAEAGWGMVANHGGGYSYRLCRLPVGGRGELTEECFQQTPLKFANEMSWVQVVDLTI